MTLPPTLPRTELEPSSALRRLHLTVGIVGILAFLGTGQFMDRRLDHLVGMADAPRALYRSAHIYILFSALLNFLLGVYLRPARPRIARLAQYLGSAFLVLSLALLLYGFFVETPLAMIERPRIRIGIVWSLWGALLHGGAGLLNRPLTARDPEGEGLHGDR